MVFNWFRRKYNNDESATPQAEEQNTSTPIQESPAESTQVTSQEQPTPDPALDKLSFAKAAYKNIQQRQQVQVSEVGEVEEAEQATDTQATVEPAELPAVESTVEPAELSAVESTVSEKADESTVSPI